MAKPGNPSDPRSDLRGGLYDAVIVGAGVSGSFVASALAAKGKRVLILEAGSRFDRGTYPRKEWDASSRLYWSGGIELTHDAAIGLLRPKAVGGGSIVNQALVDRFDEEAFSSWKARSGVSFFDLDAMSPWYERAEGSLSMRKVPEAYWNENARIFQRGFEKTGHRCAPLRRAQSDCRYEDGNDCIECLAGCRIDSKQSMPVTALKQALDTGNVELLPDTEALEVIEDGAYRGVRARRRDGAELRFLGRKLVLASGAIGNSKLLLQSGMGERLPAIGQGFYTHPQYMTLARYEQPVNAHKGPFQSLKSDDPEFRGQGFKLENVFAPPAGLAMLVPGFGEDHQRQMKRIPHFACIEVAVRDTEPGTIRVGAKGALHVHKTLNAVDRERRDRGLAVVDRMFVETGAREIIRGEIAIGLHLMGGCAIGTDRSRSVVDPEFRLHGHPDIHVADSSIFPDAPGINPSLTIMALSLKAAEALTA